MILGLEQACFVPTHSPTHPLALSSNSTTHLSGARQSVGGIGFATLVITWSPVTDFKFKERKIERPLSEEQVAQERPCRHRMMVELIDDFFAEYPATAGGSDKVDTDEADEVIDAIAKTVAELTSSQDGAIRQQLIEQLMREIMNYDAEFRSEEAIWPSPMPGQAGVVSRKK
jgi:hypothetical protein